MAFVFLWQGFARRRSNAAMSCVDVLSRRRAVTLFPRDVVAANVDISAHGVDGCVRRVALNIKNGMTGATKVSKAFRATIQLRDHEVPRLQQWLSNHCALSAMFQGPRSVALVCLKDQPGSSASFARTTHGVWCHWPYQQGILQTVTQGRVMDWRPGAYQPTL